MESRQHKEYYSWEQFEEDVKKIAAWASERGFTSVYGIPRGGLVISVKLSHLMGVPLILSRDDISRDTLIVDDVIDGGGTAERFLSSVGKFRIASIFFNPAASVTPDFWVREKKQWVVFPWETDATSRYDGTVSG